MQILIDTNLLISATNQNYSNPTQNFFVRRENS